MTDTIPTVEEISPSDMGPMLREMNRGLFVRWINADIISRAGHDVRTSYLYYDKDMMFVGFALRNKLNDDVLPTLREKGIHYWSQGI